MPLRTSFLIVLMAVSHADVPLSLYRHYLHHSGSKATSHKLPQYSLDRQMKRTGEETKSKEDRGEGRIFAIGVGLESEGCSRVTLVLRLPPLSLR